MPYISSLQTRVFNRNYFFVENLLRDSINTEQDSRLSFDPRVERSAVRFDEEADAEVKDDEVGDVNTCFFSLLFLLFHLIVGFCTFSAAASRGGNCS